MSGLSCFWQEGTITSGIEIVSSGFRRLHLEFEDPGSPLGVYEDPGSPFGNYDHPGSPFGNYDHPGSPF